jgi:hypothetical protein
MERARPDLAYLNSWVDSRSNSFTHSAMNMKLNSNKVASRKIGHQTMDLGPLITYGDININAVVRMNREQSDKVVRTATVNRTFHIAASSVHSSGSS